MKKFKVQPISAAEDDTADPLAVFDNSLDNLSDDIDYIIEGFETLARKSTAGRKTAVELISLLQNSVNDTMRQIADALGQEAK